MTKFLSKTNTSASKRAASLCMLKPSSSQPGTAMFIVRSAFWLTTAFVLMAPSAGMNLGNAARSTGEDIVARGAETLNAGLAAHTCETVECEVGRAVLAQALPKPDFAAAPTDDHAAVGPAAPVPPRRPDWANR